MNKGTGAIFEKLDSRDYIYGEEIGGDSKPFDWEKGFDVEENIKAFTSKPFILKVKDQRVSSACGGYAMATLGEVLDLFVDETYQEKSPKFIYAQSHVGSGGSSAYGNFTVVKEKGWGNEADCSSIPATEQNLMDIKSISKKAFSNALTDLAFSYAYVPKTIDSVAQAIRDNYGAILGITGVNNGTWLSSFPKPPKKTDSDSWNHWVYLGKAKLIKGKKYLGFLNSWGNSVGDKGWQWISEEYFKANFPKITGIWAVYTIVPRYDQPIKPLVKLTSTLRYGNIHPAVQNLQNALKKLNFFPEEVNITDRFYTITLNSLKTFQKAQGLTPDGIAGPKTNARINMLLKL